MRVGMCCPTCKELTLNIKGHKCHELIKRQVNRAIDKVIKEELRSGSIDLDEFWDAKDTKFTQYLLENDKFELE